jgi:hypothetical protein
MTLLWLLEPAAIPEDGRWQGRKIWRSVLVAAPTAALARAAAERWASHGVASNENLKAGFSDEKLYYARPAPDQSSADLESSSEGSRVLAADRLFDPQ